MCRIPRTLSAFDRASNRWAVVSLCDQAPSRPVAPAVGRQTLSLTTWNIQASEYRSDERAGLILDHILEGHALPDIVFLQEVTLNARKSLLHHPVVRSSFLTTDAEDTASFTGVDVPFKFATMTLLSNRRFGPPLLTDESNKSEGGQGTDSPKLAVDSVFRTTFPSRYNRDALCVDIAAPGAPGTILRLLNVHLDSFDSQFRRTLEMRILADLLREPGCSGGVVAGDFNAFTLLDHSLVDRHGLVDAWVALRGATGGETWGVGMRPEFDAERKPRRLDKVVMLSAQPRTIDVLKPGLIGPRTPWSDHCGLHCTFAI
ncbi:hypothetical protein MKEN_00233200 [Mycena kentingensis (nom. inval.)]|nr:hypothetical protein MKEN_00233200 [Mycena kentingensis (nom. inval.)]